MYIVAELLEGLAGIKMEVVTHVWLKDDAEDTADEIEQDFAGYFRPGHKTVAIFGPPDAATSEAWETFLVSDLDALVENAGKFESLISILSIPDEVFERLKLEHYCASTEDLKKSPG